MKFSDRLKQHSGSDLDSAGVDAFASILTRLASQRARHFTAGAISRETTLQRETAQRLLMLAVEAGLVLAVYEVECPRCGSLVGEWPDQSFRAQGYLGCERPNCENRFQPTGNDVRVLFDFAPEHLPQGNYVPG